MSAEHDFKVVKVTPSIGESTDWSGVSADELQAFHEAGRNRDREQMKAALLRAGFTLLEAEQATDEVLAWVEHYEFSNTARRARDAFGVPVKVFRLHRRALGLII